MFFSFLFFFSLPCNLFFSKILYLVLALTYFHGFSKRLSSSKIYGSTISHLLSFSFDLPWIIKFWMVYWESFGFTYFEIKVSMTSSSTIFFTMLPRLSHESNKKVKNPKWSYNDLSHPSSLQLRYGLTMVGYGWPCFNMAKNGHLLFMMPYIMVNFVTCLYNTLNA